MYDFNKGINNICVIEATLLEWLFQKDFRFLSSHNRSILTYKAIEGCRKGEE